MLEKIQNHHIKNTSDFPETEAKFYVLNTDTHAKSALYEKYSGLFHCCPPDPYNIT